MKNMTEGEPLKLIIPFMIPLLIGNVFQQLYNIADIIIVGRTIGGFSVVTGQLFGAGDLDGVRRSAAMSTMLCTMFVIIMMAAAVMFIDPVLALMNIPPELYADAKSYVMIIVYGLIFMMAYNMRLIFMMAYNMLSNILRSLGDSKTPLYFLIVATLLNIVLALVFIINFGWGVPGSALALVVAQGFSGLLCIIYIAKKFPVLHVHLSDFKWDSRFAWEHIRMGLPMAVQFSVLGLGMIIIQAICNQFGSETIAAFTSAMRIEQLALQPMISFGLAMAVYTAQNFGARKFGRISRGVKKCSQLSLAFSLFAAIIMYFFGQEMIGIFLDNPSPKVMAEAKQYLHLSVPFYFFLSQIFIYRNSVQGMGISMIPMLSGVVELLLRSAAASYLTIDYGYTGVCYASPIAWVGSSIFLFASYHYFLRLLARKNLGFKLK